MKRNTEHSEHSTDVVFALVLFCVFASVVLMVLMSGAGAYRGVASVMEEQYEERVCINYIAAKVRHSDTAGMVSAGKFEGNDALFLDERYGDFLYRTAIYCYDGKIRELFYEDGDELYPEDGEEIIEAASLSVEMPSPGLLRVRCTGKNGNTDELLLSLRSEKEAA